MSKSRTNKLEKEAINHFIKAYDIIEGIYSGIPECCIRGFLDGRTYANVYNCLNDKQKHKLDKFNYVPCEKCLKADKITKVKNNGTSLAGEIIFTLINDIKNKV